MHIRFNFLKKKETQPAEAPLQPGAPSNVVQPLALNEQKEILKKHKAIEKEMRRAVKSVAKLPAKARAQSVVTQTRAAPMTPEPAPAKAAFFKRLFTKQHAAPPVTAPLPVHAPAPSSSSRASVVAQQHPSQAPAKDAAAAAAIAQEAERKRAAEEKALEKTRRQLLHKQSRQKKRERRTAQQQRRVLGTLLMKAGFSTKPERLQKTVFYCTLVIIALCSFLTLSIAAVAGKTAGDILLFNLGLWTAIFAFVYLFIWMVIYLYLDIRIYQRVRELEEVLPDFLQLASANISAGMPIDRALWFAVRPNFGVLAKEIEEIAKATLAGEELNESLTHFTEKLIR